MAGTANRLVRKKNVTYAVTANANVMFMPGGQVYGWNRRLVNQIKKHTASFAPSNERPRWGHYGKPLKQTIESTKPDYRQVRHGARLYAAVGSTAHYAQFVDQGTGVYAGGSPWGAKILPPWQARGFTLWEHTWRPPGETEALGKKMIQGQRPQRFMEKGLDRAFRYMVNRGAQVPTDPVKMSRALAAWPKNLENFVGSTPNNGAFKASLEQWRAERDAAFSGPKGQRPALTDRQRKDRQTARDASNRRADRAKSTEKPSRMDEDRAATPSQVSAARDWLTENFEARGFSVVSLSLDPKARTYVAIIVPKGGGRQRPQRGKW